MMWYYALNGERQGPVDPAQLAQLVEQGTVTPETLVWRQGMANWQAYGSIAAAEGLPVPAMAGVPAADTEVCAVSGRRYPRREMLQYEGKWVSADHRDEFLQRLREGVALPSAGAVPGPYGYGGFWIRFLAALIDGLAVGLVGFVIMMIMASIVGVTGGFERTEIAVIFQIVTQLISIGLALGYELYFVRKFDATPGKLALGLKLLRADGSKLSVGRIIGRYFAKWVSSLILMIGYIMAGVDEQKRALHDIMCDTRVIKSRR